MKAQRRVRARHRGQGRDPQHGGQHECERAVRGRSGCRAGWPGDAPRGRGQAAECVACVGDSVLVQAARWRSRSRPTAIVAATGAEKGPCSTAAAPISPITTSPPPDRPHRQRPGSAGTCAGSGRRVSRPSAPEQLAVRDAAGSRRRSARRPARTSPCRRGRRRRRAREQEGHGRGPIPSPSRMPSPSSGARPPVRRAGAGVARARPTDARTGNAPQRVPRRIRASGATAAVHTRNRRAAPARGGGVRPAWRPSRAASSRPPSSRAALEGV